MSDIELLNRRLDRERKARLEAESILEGKSRELYNANVELTRVAAELKDEIEKNQAILDHAAEGIVTINHQCKIQSFNPAAEGIFGLTGSEASERSFSDLLPDFSTKQCQQVIDRGSFGPEEIIGLKPDGTQFVVELTMSCVSGIEEDLLIAIIRDRSKRKQLESQLAFAQKMESVGQLAAGIAHEINTPIQFVGDNVRFLTDAFSDIESLIKAYEQLVECAQKGADHGGILDEISEKRDQADLEFIREEIPLALDQSKTGVDRVATIVRAMKEFSHPGVEDATTVDVNAALESTITVSRNEWKYVAALETNFEANLPNVLGFPGELNQAFLNIIVNAAHAIEKKGSFRQELGTITISTSRIEDGVEIRIADNGCGIPEGDQQRIFEPFFTTKPVGKGTGQGLMMVHQVIVEKHRGRITVDSTHGIGTEFIIELPIDPTRDEN